LWVSVKFRPVYHFDSNFVVFRRRGKSRSQQPNHVSRQLLRPQSPRKLHRRRPLPDRHFDRELTHPPHVSQPSNRFS
jgi:hypothetical protein